MAQNRGSQRGVMKVASSLLLAGMGALLSVAGCSAGDGIAEQPEAVEAAGSIQQALTCNKLQPCPTDTCTKWSCTAGTCVALETTTPDGRECYDADKNPGICAEGVCCTGGCATKSKLGGYTCRRGTELSYCGQPGTFCSNCAAGGDRCQDYFCSEKRLCDSSAVPDGKACTDGSGICAKGACCTGCFDGGACQPGTSAKLCGVGGAEKCENCDDGNPCTVDSCGSTGCVHTAVEAGTSCDDDANQCNGTAKCEGTVCKTSPAKVCNDGNPCTNDSCVTSTGLCEYKNNTAACSDGDVCTLVDKCSGGKCVGTGAPNCDDNEPCTDDTVCDKVLGCQNKPIKDGTTCSDGNDCSTGDQCKSGKCTATGGKSCDDMNPCTQNACANNICGPVNEPPGTACVYDSCHVNSQCQAGTCTAGDLIKCDDGNPCTTDSCDPESGCKFVDTDGGTCSDGDLCTIEDKCSGGKCVGKEMSCAAIDDCHVAGTCNAKSGTCDDPRAPDDTECADGKGKCVVGKCDVPTAEGGAGGEGPTGQGGEVATQGGAPTGEGGEGNPPTSGGEGATPSGGTGGTGGTEPEPVDETRVFKREPGGCSCNVPASSPSNLTWLAGLGALALVAARRRGGARPERRTS